MYFDGLYVDILCLTATCLSTFVAKDISSVVVLREALAVNKIAPLVATVLNRFAAWALACLLLVLI